MKNAPFFDLVESSFDEGVGHPSQKNKFLRGLDGGGFSKKGTKTAKPIGDRGPPTVKPFFFCTGTYLKNSTPKPAGQAAREAATVGQDVKFLGRRGLGAEFPSSVSRPHQTVKIVVGPGGGFVAASRGPRGLLRHSGLKRWGRGSCPAQRPSVCRKSPRGQTGRR